jgi:hypothetical protein
MGVVLMSKRELNRIDVLARLDGRRLTTLAAADLMRVSLRQTHTAQAVRLRLQTGGVVGRRTTACLMSWVIAPSRWSGSTTWTLVRRWPPRSWPNVMMCGYRERRCADRCGERDLATVGRAQVDRLSRTVFACFLRLLQQLRTHLSEDGARLAIG